MPIPSRTKSNESLLMNVLHMRASAVLVVTLLLIAGCGQGAKTDAPADKTPAASAQKDGAADKDAKSHDKAELKFSAEEIQTAGITTAVLEQQEVREQIAVTATIEANQDRFASIAPRVSGRVTRVLAGLGDKVRQGQVLALIDSIDAGEAQSAYTQALSESALADAGLQRAEKLYADQIIPQKDYLRARADAQKARAVLRAATDRRHALGIGGQDAGKPGESSVIPLTAPFAGTIIAKKAVMGELAQPDKALFAVADLSNVWIETNLFEKDMHKVKPGVAATVTTAAYPDQIFSGKVTYISSVMDKETHTVKARVEVPNPDGKLKIDMFANAAIDTATSVKAFTLPADAVVLIQGQPTAFIQDAEGFSARAVELGEKLRNQVILKAGIRHGEKVVIQGAYALKAKMLKSQISAD
jgi:membrane fusion protein, heavy metal efflux system